MIVRSNNAFKPTVESTAAARTTEQPIVAGASGVQVDVIPQTNASALAQAPVLEKNADVRNEANEPKAQASEHSGTTADIPMNSGADVRFKTLIRGYALSLTPDETSSPAIELMVRAKRAIEAYHAGVALGIIKTDGLDLTSKTSPAVQYVLAYKP